MNLNAFESSFEHLLQPFRVGHKTARQVEAALNVKDKFAILRFVTERPRHRVQQAREEDFLGFDGNCAGFNLGQIEDVANQVQQVSSGTVNRAGELDLLGRQLPSGLSLSCWPRTRMRSSGVRSSCDMFARQF